MPGFLVNMSSVVLCAHGGKATPTVPMPRVKIMGAPAVTLGPPWVIAGCPFPPPPVANGPCVTGNVLVGTVRVKAMGMPLVVQSSASVCVPTGTPMSVVFANARVRAM